MTDKLIDIEVTTRNRQYFNFFSRDAELIYSKCQSINQTYEMLTVTIDKIDGDFVFVTIQGVVLPIDIQTVESYQQYLEERFKDSAEYDRIFNLWDEKIPNNLKEAKNLVVDALEDEVYEWLLLS